MTSGEKPAPLVALAQSAVNWWRDATSSGSGGSDADRFPGEELDRIAGDAGVASSDLRQLARQPAWLPVLLRQRLTSLGLEPETIRQSSPLVLADLQRVCCGCPEKNHCSKVIGLDTPDPGWQSYCPNGSTLSALEA